MNQKMKSQLTILSVVIFSVLLFSFGVGIVWANGGGINGYSGNPATNAGATCDSCHTGGTDPVVSVEGPTLLMPGQTAVYTLSVLSTSPVVQTRAGFNVSVSNGNLTVVEAGTQLLFGEMTHQSPRLISGVDDTARFTYQFTAPLAPMSNVTMYGAGNSVDFSGDEFGDNAHINSLGITISSYNAPVANNDSDSTNEDTPLLIDVLANDTDADFDPLTIIFVSVPGNGTASIQGGMIAYTPTLNYFGADSFTYTISDGALEDTATVNLTINPVNDPPTTVGDTDITAENTPIVISVLANDFDPEGSALTLISVGAATNGTTEMVGSTAVYTPDLAFQGADWFTYQVSDGSLLSTGYVTVTVNTPPVAVDDNQLPVIFFEEQFDTGFSDWSATGLWNPELETDGCGSLVAPFPSSSQAAYYGQNGICTYNTGGTNSGELTLQIGQNLAGLTNPHLYFMSYSVTECQICTYDKRLVQISTAGLGGPWVTILDVGTVQNSWQPIDLDLSAYVGSTVHLRFRFNTVDGSVNDYFGWMIDDLQFASDRPATTNEDTEMKVAPAGILINDTDADLDPLTALIETLPANGSLSLGADGSFSYMPDLNFNGADSFTYRAFDGYDNSANVGTVFLTVNPVNDPPVADDDVALTNVDTPVLINVLANDSDVDLDPLLVSGFPVPPSSGVANVIGNNVVYTPFLGFQGVEVFSYRIDDPGGYSDDALITITVNDLPVANGDFYILETETTLSLPVPGVMENDFDANGDGLTAVLDIAPTNGVLILNGDGSFSYTPDLGFAGVDRFSYHLTDGFGDSQTVWVTLPVIRLPQFPTDNKFGTGVDSSLDLAVGDMNGDGALDIVVGNRGGQDQIYWNDGAGRFNQISPTNFGDGSSSTYRIKVGDLNNDGDLDIAVAINGAANAIHLNNGDGTFTESAVGTAATTRDLVLGDIDWDGDLDMIEARFNLDPNIVYLNDGSGGFGTSYQLRPTADSSFALALGDLDNDGDLDVVVGNRGEQNVVLLNNGKGLFGAVTNIGSPTTATYDIGLADLERDGDLDLVIINENEANGIYFNDGSGLFGAPITFGTVSDASRGQVLADLNGDGYVDLAVSNYEQQNRLYMNDGNGRFDRISPIVFGTGTDAVWWGVAAADFNNDGALDLVAGSNGGQNGVYYNNGVGKMLRNSSFGSDLDDTQELVIGDFNGDGRIDLVEGNDGQMNVAYYNTGSGFTAGNSFGGADGTSALLTADLNGDDTLDLIVGNSGGQNLIYLNDGSGDWSMAIVRNWGSGTDNTADIAIVDIDLDGDLDIIAANNGQSNRVYLNDGVGNFPLSQLLGAGTEASESIAVGDLNGDGYTDVVVANYGQANQLFLNNGSGNWGAGSSWGMGSDNSWVVALADLDGDDDLDIISGHFVGELNHIYWNDGSGGFDQLPAQQFGLGSNDTRAIFIADMNNDQMLDIVVGNNGQQNRIYFNNEDHDFNLLNGPVYHFGWGDDLTMALAVADFNHDGDWELVSGNSFGMNEIYRNSRQRNLMLPDNGSGVEIKGAQSTPLADFYATPKVLTDTVINIPYALYDWDGSNSGQLNWSYSLNGGGSWLPAVGTTEETHLTAVAVDDFDTSIDPANWTIAAGGVATAGYCGGVSGNGFNMYQAGLRSLETVDFNLVGGGELQFELKVGNNVPASCEFVDAADTIYLQYSTNGGAGWNTLAAYGSGTFSTYTVVHIDVPPVAQAETTRFRWIQPAHSGLNFDVWGLDNVAIRPNGKSGVFNWDSFASGFFGQSDQVVMRAEASVAAPAGSSSSDPYLHLGQLPGPYQYSYGAGISFPFRARGTQIRVVGEGPIGYWSLDEGAGVVAIDQSGNGLNGSLLNGAGFTASTPLTTTFGNPSALVLDGVNDHLRISDHSSINFASDQDFAISLWVKADPVQPTTTFWDNDIVEKWSQAGGNYPYVIRYHNSTSPFAGRISAMRFDGVNNPTINSVATIDDNQYHHILYMKDGGTLYLYIDGVLDSQVADSTTGITENSSDLFIGQRGNNINNFKGEIDDLRIYNRPLSINEVEQLANGRLTPGLEDSLVLREGSGESQFSPMANGNNVPFVTRLDGYLQGRGQVGLNDQLVAMLPITATDSYTLYFTSAAITETGVVAHAVEQAGLQTLVVRASNPLLLFNLDISLEWDARNDSTYMNQLQLDINRVSDILFDISNGQVALGDVTVYQGKENWTDAHVLIYAANNIRPTAAMGGIVMTTTHDIISPTMVITDAYLPGQARMGATWNRFGDPNANLGEDWPRALAHELGHLLLFLSDNYLGVSDGGLISTDCYGSFMTDAYADEYSELLTQLDWSGECLNTIAEYTTGRPDWETVLQFYPWLNTDNADLAGPTEFPLGVTDIEIVTPAVNNNPLAAPLFPLRDGANQPVYVPNGQGAGYLFKNADTPQLGDDYLIAVGSPSGDQLHARGAEPGDRLCVYDLSGAVQQIGCTTVGALEAPISMSPLPGWNPQIVMEPITVTISAPPSLTIGMIITVNQLITTGTVYVQVLPSTGLTETFPISATSAAMIDLGGMNMTFTQMITLPYPAWQGYIRIWVDGIPETKEAMSQFSLGGGWGANRMAWGANRMAWGANRMAWGANRMAWGAPVASPDGQVIIFNIDDILGDTGVASLQALLEPPSLPHWLVPVGQAYRFRSSEPFTRTIAFSYLQTEVAGGNSYEPFLSIYYSADNGESWDRLVTTLDTLDNAATAKMPLVNNGEGIYALISTINIPPFTTGWNNFGYPIPESREVTKTLASIDPDYTTIYNYDAFADQWKMYDRPLVKDHPTFMSMVNDLDNLEFGKGYWIYATQPVTLYLAPPDGGAGFTSSYEQQQSFAFEMPPATYYGWVTPTALFTPTVGMGVVAEIGGVDCGSTTIQTLDGKLAYSLQVEAEKVFGPPNNCGTTALTVTFKIGSWTMDHDRQWDNQQAWYHPLTDVCQSPADVVDLSIGQSGNDVQLSWSASVADYEIHRSSTPYFAANAGNLWDSVTGNSYSDIGALGNPATNYYYQTIGVSSCGLSGTGSNEMGEFDFTIVPGA